MGERRRKNQKLQIWISPEIRRQLNETAREMGLTPSEIARQAIVHYLMIVPRNKETVGKGD